MLEKITPKLGLVLGVTIIITVGVLSGFGLSRLTVGENLAPKTADGRAGPQASEIDTATFRDRAVGIIEKNQADDQYAQGTHRLIREGGPTQTAYLVSSVVDLGAYVGKNVEVWGETFASTQVGWLMDVGKVNVIK